jgi:6-phosphogluconolactonase
MKPVIKIFQTPFEMAESLAIELIKQVKDADRKNSIYTIAVSGGKTPQLFFSVLADHFAGAVKWEHVHFFWVDERCVPPGNAESNFGMTRTVLFPKLKIPEENIHRIRGEEDPEKEAKRYETELKKFTKKRDGLPCIDLMLLGVGEDGHTASIFPGNEKLFSEKKLSVPALHPVTGQERITLTGKVINNSESVIFMVAGKSKEKIVSDILKDKQGKKQSPASYVLPAYGTLFWYLDKEAGSMLGMEEDLFTLNII